MHLAIDRPFESLAEVAHIRAGEWSAAIGEAPMTARYGEATGRRWPLLAIVVAAHAIGIALLAIAVAKPEAAPPPQPLVMTLVPEPVAPPKPAPLPPKPESAAPVRHDPPPPLDAPAPIVAVAAPPPAAAPAPVPVTAVSAPAAPAAAGPTPEPAVLPPDGYAATLHNPAPAYPLASRRRHEEGTVRLRVDISAEGRVLDVAVAWSSGFDLLDRAALDAVKRWRFVPGSRGGVPVAATGSLSIPFRLT